MELWKRNIRKDTNNKSIDIKIETKDWDIQGPKSLRYLIKKIELDN